MTSSATAVAPAGRAAKRQETSRRIVRHAVDLTVAHGLDGWTMEDLAAAADVSRRTLFNYFTGKVDAVIGPVPDLPAAAIAQFRAGGPGGILLDDLGRLAGAILLDEQIDADHRVVMLRRELITRDPQLLMIVHERFEAVVIAVVDHIVFREGPDFGVHRARLLVRLLVTLFDYCVGELGESDRSLAAMYADVLDDARALFA